MVVANREDFAKKVRILRDHGMSPERRKWHPSSGYNYRLTNLQAALEVAQMERIDDILEKKQLAVAYSERLKDIAGIQHPPKSRGWIIFFGCIASLLIKIDRQGMI